MNLSKSQLLTLSEYFWQESDQSRLIEYGSPNYSSIYVWPFRWRLLLLVLGVFSIWLSLSTCDDMEDSVEILLRSKSDNEISVAQSLLSRFHSCVESKKDRMIEFSKEVL